MAVDDAYTISLIHPFGEDESTSISDESGKAWTAGGTAKIDTAQSYFPDASLYFNTGDNYISTPDSADWRLDGGSNSNSWTWDARIRFETDPGAGIRGFWQQYVDDGNRFGLYITNFSELTFVIRTGAVSTVVITNTWNPAANTWYHIAVVKQGTTGYKMFIDGTQVGSTQTDTDVMPDLAGTFYLGKYISGGPTNNGMGGWMQESRFSKGIARWTANFTPPTDRYGGGGQVIFWSSED